MPRNCLEKWYVKHNHLEINESWKYEFRTLGKKTSIPKPAFLSPLSVQNRNQVLKPQNQLDLKSRLYNLFEI